MQNLLLFLIRYGTLLTFLLLEFVCLYLLVQNNDQQKEIYVYSSNLATGAIYNKYSKVTDFINLKEVNDSLAASNARLMERLFTSETKDSIAILNSTLNYHVIAAKVINNSILGRNNLITLDKGFQHGIRKSMGLIHPNGIIGIIKSTSENYSTALSILNTDVTISAKVKRTNHFGSLSWSGNNPQFLSLSAIPKHTNVRLGDTIVTTAFSTIFPPDLPIGIVSNVQLSPGRGDFSLEVRLFIDLSNIKYAYTVALDEKEEILQLEKKSNL